MSDPTTWEEKDLQDAHVEAATEDLLEVHTQSLDRAHKRISALELKTSDSLRELTKRIDQFTGRLDEVSSIPVANAECIGKIQRQVDYLEQAPQIGNCCFCKKPIRIGEPHDKDATQRAFHVACGERHRSEKSRKEPRNTDTEELNTNMLLEVRRLIVEVLKNYGR